LVVVVLSCNFFKLHAPLVDGDQIKIAGVLAVLHSRPQTKHSCKERIVRPGTAVDVVPVYSVTPQALRPGQKLPSLPSAPRPTLPQSSHYPLHYSASPPVLASSVGLTVRQKKKQTLSSSSSSGMATPTSSDSASMTSGSSGHKTPASRRRARSKRMLSTSSRRLSTPVPLAALDVATKKHGVVISLPLVKPEGRVAMSLSRKGEKIFLPEKPGKEDLLYFVYDYSEFSFEDFRLMWITTRHGLHELRERLFEFRKYYTRLVANGKTAELLAACNESARLGFPEYGFLDDDAVFKSLADVNGLYHAAHKKYEEALWYGEKLCMGDYVDLSFDAHRFLEEYALPADSVPIGLLRQPACLQCSAYAEARVAHPQFNAVSLEFNDECSTCHQRLLQRIYDEKIVFDPEVRAFVSSAELQLRSIVMLTDAFETADYYLKCLRLNMDDARAATRGACGSSLGGNRILPERRMDAIVGSTPCLARKDKWFGVAPAPESPTGSGSKYSVSSSEDSLYGEGAGVFVKPSTPSTKNEITYKKLWIACRNNFASAYEGLRQLILNFKDRCNDEIAASKSKERKVYFQTLWKQSLEDHIEQTLQFFEKIQQLARKNNELMRIAAPLFSLDCNEIVYENGRGDMSILYFSTQRCPNDSCGRSILSVRNENLCACGTNLIIPRNYLDVERFLRSVGKNLEELVAQIFEFNRYLRPKSLLSA